MSHDLVFSVFFYSFNILGIFSASGRYCCRTGTQHPGMGTALVCGDMSAHPGGGVSCAGSGSQGDSVPQELTPTHPRPEHQRAGLGRYRCRQKSERAVGSVQASWGLFPDLEQCPEAPLPPHSAVKASRAANPQAREGEDVLWQRPGAERGLGLGPSCPTPSDQRVPKYKILGDHGSVSVLLLWKLVLASA